MAVEKRPGGEELRRMELDVEEPVPLSPRSLLEIAEEDSEVTPYHPDYPEAHLQADPESDELPTSPHAASQHAAAQYAAAQHAAAQHAAAQHAAAQYAAAQYAAAQDAAAQDAAAQQAHAQYYSSLPPAIMEAEMTVMPAPRALERMRAGLEQVRAWTGQSWAEARSQLGELKVARLKLPPSKLDRLRLGRVIDSWLPERVRRVAWMRQSAPYLVGLGALSSVAIGAQLASGPEPDHRGSWSATTSTAADQDAAPTLSRPEGPASAVRQGTVPMMPMKATASPSALNRAAAPLTGARPAPPAAAPRDEAGILLTLAESLAQAGRDLDVVPVLERALLRDPKLSEDARFARVLRETALSDNRMAASLSYLMLIGPMGERGAEILYEIALMPDARKGVRRRADYWIHTKDFARKASLPIYAAYKLRAAESCEAKKSLLSFAVEAGGRHALEYLQELDKRKVCSLEDLENCFPCMNADSVLPNAVSALEARLGQ